MPAIPVMAQRVDPPADAPLLRKQGIVERGDHIYMTTPVEPFVPSDSQIEEYAFTKELKSQAPNENITWFKGQYVEADNPNGNGAMWEANELAIKSLTPMLMPVTVMHDPRSAVGTIADVKMVTPEADGVSRARIDTVLALWRHRFPEVVKEAEINAQHGTLMQSMEAYSPWYACSECKAVFHKLPGGAEQADWCDHLKESNPTAGFVDLGKAAQRADASRILGDVCFTGTGLIFGTRGAEGAYSEAHLEHWGDELAALHHTTHTATATDQRSATGMGLVQIEQSELDTLRKERDDARTTASSSEEAKKAAETAAEQAEAAKTAAESERDTAKSELTTEQEKSARAQLKDTRLGALGSAFTDKLGDFTKSRLHEQASTLKDEEWEDRLKELEETTAVKRDAKKDGESEQTDEEKAAAAAAAAGSPDFKPEELANLQGLGGGGNGAKAPTQVERSSVVGSLSDAFSGNGKKKDD